MGRPFAAGETASISLTTRFTPTRAKKIYALQLALAVEGEPAPRPTDVINAAIDALAAKHKVQIT